MNLEQSRNRALDLCPEMVCIEKELLIYEALLLRWSKSHNLVSANTLSDIWLRHFADSAQLLKYAPKLMRWADVGSGAGFPGLVLAIMIKNNPGAVVHLIESDQRKVAFLREVSRETAAPTVIHLARAEARITGLAPHIDVICSRAMAPLVKLVDIAEPVLECGGMGIFPKGKTAQYEILMATRSADLSFRTEPSKTASDASIVIVEPRFQSNSLVIIHG